MAIRFPHFTIFRILYNSTYTILILILLVLLAVTPGDHIYQIVANGNIGNVFVVGGVYVATGIIALFIYASRLYTNRQALAAIPKSYIPIEDGEISRRVRKIIVKNRQRSAIITYDARPRDLNIEQPRSQGNLSPDADAKSPLAATTLQRVNSRKKTQSMDTFIPVSRASPPWGIVIHPGWSSPSSDDLPAVQFDTVVAELPNLIEAKAVSLAPPDPNYGYLAHFAGQQNSEAPPDPRAVQVLQRTSSTGLRAYLDKLNSLGMFDPPTLVEAFLDKYEYARFSTDLLLENEFRDLMAAFSDVLMGMVDVNPDVLLAEAENDGQLSLSTGSRSSDTASLLLPRRAQMEPRTPSDASSLLSTESVVRHDVTASGNEFS